MARTVPARIKTKYDLTLFRLAEADLEMTRRWRNDERISQFMEYRQYITFAMQKEWFASVNNENNYYFVVEYRDRKIGLAHTKNICWQRKIGEGGQFIYDERLLHTPVAYQIALAMTDFGFYELGLEAAIVRILRTNRRAIRFNQSYGFVLQPGQEDVQNQIYSLTKARYEKKSKWIKNTLARLLRS